MSTSSSSHLPFRPPTGFLAATGVLLLAFAWPLFQLARFAWSSTLYSHILLIPVVTFYLIRLRRREFAPGSAGFSPLALVPLAGGLGLLLWFAAATGWTWAEVDRLATTTAAFVLLAVAAAIGFLPAAWRRPLAFPLGFLVFMIPFPTAVVETLETFLQHGSAAAARGLFAVAGPSLFYHDLVFEFPGGFSMQVAPECSGIHSSLVLFVTSVLAGHLFLRSGWKRGALSLFVVPLALVRNGFRVFVIGQLCVNIGPEMIHSWIHRKGGPVFFALSLVPFLALLWLLVRSERGRGEKAKGQIAAAPSGRR